MDPGARKAFIAGHIRSMSRRSGIETNRLTAMLTRSCWPGSEDRTEPVALEWLRRWSPQRAGISAPFCSCRDGYCAVCN